MSSICPPKSPIAGAIPGPVSLSESVVPDPRPPPPAEDDLALTALKAQANEAAQAAELRDAMKTANLERQIEETKAKIAEVEKSLAKVNEELGSVDAEAIVRRHIKLLHDYNDIKDVGSGLFGLIADRRGVQLKDIYEEFGVKESD